jgi:integrase
VTTTPLFWRGAYHVRITGNGSDTRRKIPAEVFGGIPNDKQSKKADRVARRYADEMEDSNGDSERRQGVEGKEAEDAKDSVQPSTARTRRGDHRPSLAGTLTIAQIGALFLSRNSGTLDPKTITRYGQIVSQLVDFFGDMRPDQIHVGELEKYRDHRLGAQWTPRLGTVGRRQISPRTVWGELTFAVKLLGFGFDRSLETGMTSLPVRKAPDVADRCRTRGRALTMEEFWRAYDAVGALQRAGDRYQRMLVLGLTTMLRENPLLNLSYDWMDLTAGTVTIPPQFVKKGRGRARKELTLPLSAWAVEVIRRVGAAGPSTNGRDQEPAGAEQGERNWGLVRETVSGTATPASRHETGSTDPLTECVWGAPIANVQPTLVRIAHIAGIRPFSLHDLRRTGATILLNHRCDLHPQGIAKFTVDRLLGHAMPLIDQAYYSVGMDALRDAVSVFGEEWDKRRGVDGVNVVAIGRK